jgi:hypothetical protein
VKHHRGDTPSWGCATPAQPRPRGDAAVCVGVSRASSVHHSLSASLVPPLTRLSPSTACSVGTATSASPCPPACSCVSQPLDTTGVACGPRASAGPIFDARPHLRAGFHQRHHGIHSPLVEQLAGLDVRRCTRQAGAVVDEVAPKRLRRNSNQISRCCTIQCTTHAAWCMIHGGGGGRRRTRYVNSTAPTITPANGPNDSEKDAASLSSSPARVGNPCTVPTHTAYSGEKVANRDAGLARGDRKWLLER